MMKLCQSLMQGRNAKILELEGSLADLEAQQASMEEAAQSQHAEVRFIDFAHMLLYKRSISHCHIMTSCKVLEVIVLACQVTTLKKQRGAHSEVECLMEMVTG